MCLVFRARSFCFEGLIEGLGRGICDSVGKSIDSEQTLINSSIQPQANISLSLSLSLSLSILDFLTCCLRAHS